MRRKNIQNVMLAMFIGILTACADPSISRLNEDSYRSADNGIVQRNCGRFVVPDVVDDVHVPPSGFGLPVESLLLEGLDCYTDDSIALNEFSRNQQVIVNGVQTKIYARNNSIVAVANENIVGEWPLEKEMLGGGNTGRWIVPVDETTSAQDGVLSLALR